MTDAEIRRLIEQSIRDYDSKIKAELDALKKQINSLP